MPLLDVKISKSLDAAKSDQLHTELTNLAASALGKPAMYVMISVATQSDLWMGGRKLDDGAYVQVKAFGSISDSQAQTFARKATDLLDSEFGLSPAGIYISFEGFEQWAWQGNLF